MTTSLVSNPDVRRDYLGEGHCNYCGQRARVWSLSLIHNHDEELRTELPGAFCSVACGHEYHKVMLAGVLA